MSDDAALFELASLHGIEHGYHDIWGNWHGLTASTARALLRAMGVDVSDPQALAQALAQRRERGWDRVLAPVVVAHAGTSPRVAVCVPQVAGDAPIRWTLRLEDGHERSGEMPPAALAVLDSRDGDPSRKLALDLPADLPIGYHRLTVRVHDREGCARVILAPARCVQPPRTAQGARAWGVSIQLYALRSARNWGIGDFGDLAAAVDVLADLGASLVGLNPLHALFAHAPGHASPYSPASRIFLNAAYLHVEAIPDFAECAGVRAQVASPAFRQRLQELRAPALVDHAHAVALKMGVLRELFGHFRREHLAAGTARAREFHRFVQAGGDALRLHAVFQALHATLSHDPRRPWPDEYLDPDSPAVAAFAREHGDDVDFHLYLQWNTRLQLDAAAARARARGMRIGLYLDLAVGSDSHGADAWADPQLHATDISVGAPPDDFSLQGQVWGLPPWRPDVLYARGYQPFVDCLRAIMRGAGAVRIDHVLGLLRLFWVPASGSAADGAYVRYPVHDLLAIVALESVRHDCVVVGEDLGTVPDEIRGALHERGVLSYRVLYFEKHWDGDHSFRAPEHYPEQALVTVTTHDLATFAGYWSEHDLDLRDALHLFPDAHAAAGQREGRGHDRGRLLDALARAGLRPETIETQDRRPSEALTLAVHRYLARTPAALFNVQMEDVLGVVEQVNVPGTVEEHPNWQRKLPVAVEDWAARPLLRALADALARERAVGG